MSVREIEAAFLIIEASFVEEKEPDEDARRSMLQIARQFFVDIHTLAEAAEILCQQSIKEVK